MTEGRVPTVNEALDEPIAPGRLAFVNKNLILSLGGAFVAALAVLLLIPAMKEDATKSDHDDAIASALASQSMIEQPPSNALQEELARQKREAEAEERARLQALEDARRAATSPSVTPSAGALRPSVQPDNTEAELEAARRVEEARRQREETIRGSNIIALQGPGARSAASSSATHVTDRPAAPFAPSPTGSGAQINPLIEQLMARAIAGQSSPETANALQDPRTSTGDHNADWLTLYSAGTETQAPILRDPAVTFPIVLQGAAIPAAIITEINSDLPGQITAQVTMDIYDSHGRYLLIPKGSRLVGSYNNDVRPGQERVMAAFQRLIRPDGVSIDLGGMPTADALGRSGVRDEVDNHFWKMFGSSFLIAGIAWLTERDQPQTVTVQSGATGEDPLTASGRILEDLTELILERNRRIPPTLRIRYGHKINVMVTRDLGLPPVPSR